MKSSDNLLSLEVRCAGCGRLLLRVECDPEANAIGVLTCPHCGSEEMLDITDRIVSHRGL